MNIAFILFIHMTKLRSLIPSNEIYIIVKIMQKLSKSNRNRNRKVIDYHPFRLVIVIFRIETAHTGKYLQWNSSSKRSTELISFTLVSI